MIAFPIILSLAMLFAVANAAARQPSAADANAVVELYSPLAMLGVILVWGLWGWLS